MIIQCPLSLSLCKSELALLYLSPLVAQLSLLELIDLIALFGNLQLPLEVVLTFVPTHVASTKLISQLGAEA